MRRRGRRRINHVDDTTDDTTDDATTDDDAQRGGATARHRPLHHASAARPGTDRGAPCPCARADRRGRPHRDRRLNRRLHTDRGIRRPGEAHPCRWRGSDLLAPAGRFPGIRPGYSRVHPADMQDLGRQQRRRPGIDQPRRSADRGDGRLAHGRRYRVRGGPLLPGGRYDKSPFPLGRIAFALRFSPHPGHRRGARYMGCFKRGGNQSRRRAGRDDHSHRQELRGLHHAR